MNSPFPYDNIANIGQFQGRKKELDFLEELFLYSNNLLIYSKRRMGKTSLIKYFFEKNRDKYLCIYVDIFDITSKEEFALVLLKAIANANKKENIKTIIKKLGSFFKRVRVEPTIDTQTLEYSIKPVVATLSFEEMMEDFFNTLKEFAKEQKIILAIDEFQQISSLKDIKLDAMLRKHIQQRENISYVFLGSKRHLLTSLFEYKAPLYELANHLYLEPLKLDEIRSYCQKHLSLEDEQIEYIYNYTDGETKLMQHIFHILYINKMKNISVDDINSVINEIINSKDGSFKIIFDMLNNNQKIALKVVSKYKQNIFSNTVLEEFNIKKQTLQSSLESLFAKELIDKNENSYFIPDRTLELWCEKM